jgi:hypothetical protein
MANDQLTQAKPLDAATIELVIADGDLSKLEPHQRVQFYAKTCESVGLNPYTRPFEYMRLNGAVRLYAKREATDQLRKIHNVSISLIERETIEGVHVVTARATMPSGRTDESRGAVSIAGKKGDDLANSLMKSETKAKRRVTLSIVGLGWLDESELETIPNARRVPVDFETGEIVDEAPKLAAPKVAPQLAAPAFDIAPYVAAIEDAVTTAEIEAARDAAARVAAKMTPAERSEAAKKAAAARWARQTPGTE